MTKRTKKFTIDGEHLALDFVNTVEWRLSDSPEEHMESYEDLLEWSRLAGVLDVRTTRQLRQAAVISPRVAAEAYRRAIELREAIYGAIQAVIHGSAPKKKVIDTLNASMKRSRRHTIISWSAGGYEWKRQRDIGLDMMLDRVVHSATELLTSAMCSKLAQCQDDRGCGWVFLDNSRSKRRRWCSMSNCGNRAKARRHYQRTTTGK